MFYFNEINHLSNNKALKPTYSLLSLEPIMKVKLVIKPGRSYLIAAQG
jgi:hypothetical protein